MTTPKNPAAYAVCEPRKYRVLARFNTSQEADKYGVTKMRAGGYTRLACVIDDTGADLLTDRKPDREYLHHGHRNVEVVVYRAGEAKR